MWNTTETQTEHHCLQIHCNNNNYSADGLSGLPLVEKLKGIARDNHINKFDIRDDANGEVVTPEDVEAGEFTGPLTIIRFNVAAA
jgi:hypothetical protein